MTGQERATIKRTMIYRSFLQKLSKQRASELTTRVTLLWLPRSTMTSLVPGACIPDLILDLDTK